VEQEDGCLLKINEALLFTFKGTVYSPGASILRNYWQMNQLVGSLDKYLIKHSEEPNMREGAWGPSIGCSILLTRV
jgi:hypothetical protein